MKKIFLILVVVMVLIILSGVFAEGSDFSEDFQDFIGNIVERRGINATNITNITSVDFNNLPDEVNLQNIDDTNLGLFQVDFADGGPPVYVITLADEKYEKYLARPKDYKRMFLNFGYKKKMSDVGFLETATGAETSLENGYVMMRGGSITGISTNLKVTKDDALGQIEVIIYKNGVAIGFGNTLPASVKEVKSDYDIQSEDTITFEAGDVISAYVDAQGDIEWKNVITIVEITTAN